MYKRHNCKRHSKYQNILILSTNIPRLSTVSLINDKIINANVFKCFLVSFINVVMSFMQQYQLENFMRNGPRS